LTEINDDPIGLTLFDDPSEVEVATSAQLPGVLILLFPEANQAIGFRGLAAEAFVRDVVLAAGRLHPLPVLGLAEEKVLAEPVLEKKLLN
jgi:hypothetical protein